MYLVSTVRSLRKDGDQIIIEPVVFRPVNKDDYKKIDPILRNFSDQSRESRLGANWRPELKWEI